MIPHRYTIYVVFEICKIFVVAITVLTGLIVLLGVVQKLVTERVSMLAILTIIPYILPVSLQFTLPSSLLFAVCTVYGRLSADNEVMALKAAGVPPRKIMAPALILGLLFSPFAVWMMDVAAFWGEPGMQRVIIGQIEQVVYHTLKTTNSYSSSSGFSISVRGVEGHKLIDPEINLQTSGSEQATISAKTGELKLMPEEDVLRVELEDAIVSVANHVECHFHHLKQDISLDKAARKGRPTDRPTNIAMHNLASETNKQRKSIDKNDELAATHVLMGLSIGRYDWLNSPFIHETNARRTVALERLARLETEPYRRWACGFSCFFFMWLGIPLSIWFRTADYWFIFGIAFLPLLLIYYPLFMMALEQAKDGAWPPYSVWLGNLGIFAVGGWFKHKVNYS